MKAKGPTLIFYSSNTAEKEKHLQIFFESFEEEDVMRFTDIESLKRRLLNMPGETNAIVVLVAENREVLSELLPVIHLFRKVRIILVLPDREPETIQIGYRLEPRFLSFLDAGIQEVRAVLTNMINKTRGLREGSAHPDHTL